MDSMEDSGFDSDQKTVANGSASSPVKTHETITPTQQPSTDDALKALKKTSELQKKLERQREIARKSQAAVDSQPKKSALLSRSRLVVPTKGEASSNAPDQQPLVMLDTDDSEEEFSMSALSHTAQREITQQLIKDGYNLDLEPDDEDLDLIPPHPINERCVCCQNPLQTGCVVQ